MQALLGPCIEAGCYEFGAADLAAVVDVLGPEVAARTRHGAPALDLPAGVRAALAARRCARPRHVAVVLHGLFDQPLLPSGPAATRAARRS